MQNLKKALGKKPKAFFNSRFIGLAKVKPTSA
jgi:hypothetical protein